MEIRQNSKPFKSIRNRCPFQCPLYLDGASVPPRRVNYRLCSLIPEIQVEKAGPNFSTTLIEFTYSITEQKGNVFAGTSGAGTFSETLIGAISPDNRSGVMSDDDGQYTFTIRDSNTLDICYQHSFPTSRVAACWTIKRSVG
ncbi:hypothetical protein BB934_37210 (plasmid) [Microvirga ossetica]|uniref:Uncharacterized protein n=1 Tax=Microvirga ossetica TaxID=1882682 RepID=A0A1B2EV90_9HYPH|nr:hypothetical protein [Microvirga ossetica]ANY83858.1 hypothetical protein BB934_37210 [Microvirga ossetica]